MIISLVVNRLSLIFYILFTVHLVTNSC